MEQGCDTCTVDRGVRIHTSTCMYIYTKSTNPTTYKEEVHVVCLYEPAINMYMYHDLVNH